MPRTWTTLYNAFHVTSVADPKLLFSDPDPDPTWRVISDPDPDPNVQVISVLDPDPELFVSKMVSLSLHFSCKRPDAQWSRSGFCWSGNYLSSRIRIRILQCCGSVYLIYGSRSGSGSSPFFNIQIRIRIQIQAFWWHKNNIFQFFQKKIPVYFIFLLIMKEFL